MPRHTRTSPPAPIRLDQTGEAPPKTGRAEQAGNSYNQLGNNEKPPAVDLESKASKSTAGGWRRNRNSSRLWQRPLCPSWRAGKGNCGQGGLAPLAPTPRQVVHLCAVTSVVRSPGKGLPQTLRIGPHETLPVVLAPMAGITNTAFRALCRGFGPGGVYVCEMITSRALVERTPESMRLIQHTPDETMRSIQLYGVDPATVAAAVRLLVTEDRADHIDLNFGCPVAKVTRKGGGAALPWKRDLFADIVKAAVTQAEPYGIPVTVKMRVGIDQDHITYLDAGRLAAQAGVAAVALHARTASQFYSGHADWGTISRLRDTVPAHIPVLGNGDIWCAADAVRMVQTTGCDGVVVGRGCLGRPWLFAELTAAFAGHSHRHGDVGSVPSAKQFRPQDSDREIAHESVGKGENTRTAQTMAADTWAGGQWSAPSLTQVTTVLRHHVDLLTDYYGGDEKHACRDIRKHIAWYFKGYPVGGDLRSALSRVDDRGQLAQLCAQMDQGAPYPGPDAEGPRGRAGGVKKVALPEGWLDSTVLSPAHAQAVREAEVSVSGG